MIKGHINNFEKFKKNKFIPEQKLDLHGQTTDQAYQNLQKVILSSHAKNMRGVLVITGKSGVLNKDVPRWLQAPPFAEVILSVKKAKQEHGGDGALYVLLRRAD